MLSNLCNICWCINSGINASEHFGKGFMVSYILHLPVFQKPLLAYNFLSEFSKSDPI